MKRYRLCTFVGLILFAFGISHAYITADISCAVGQLKSDDLSEIDVSPRLTLWGLANDTYALGIGTEVFGISSAEKPIACGFIAGRYSFQPRKRHTIDFIPSVGFGYADSEIKPKVSLSAGSRYFLSPMLQFGINVGITAFFDDEKTMFFGGGISFEYRFGFKDTDDDWVQDKFDKCAATPKDVLVDKNGCGIDSDADGVFDGLDKCPDTPLAALVDSTGCSTDTDGDGVSDGVDRCADTPSEIPVDSTGCPRDTDGDGVPDYTDSCKSTPDGAIVDNHGCPVDSDEDGIPDGLDQCDRTPTGFDIDRFGCPTIPTADGVVIYNLFKDNFELTASAMNSLHRVAKRIRAYPDRITNIYVYTDTEGSPTYNRNRARKAGKSVVQFLEEQGVDTEPVEIVPMGEKDPIIPGSSKQAKEKDRRAVFEVQKPE